VMGIEMRRFGKMECSRRLDNVNKMCFV